MMNDYLELANALNNMFYQEGTRSFPIDVVEGENQYIVYAEIPGVAKEDIKISFENGVLAIEANKKKKDKEKFLIHERSNMRMKREIQFGDIHEESLSAKYENGVLMVTVNLEAPKAKKTIEIQ